MKASEERKSHKHKHSKSKHKKHRRHHHKHHHKKSHKQDKPSDHEAPADLSEQLLEKTLDTLKTKDVVDGNTLELVMTEHLLSQLEEAEDESEDSDESSADEKEDMSKETQNPSSTSRPSSSKDGREGAEQRERVVNDPQVSSTSTSGSSSAGKPSTINVQPNSLPSSSDSIIIETTDKSQTVQNTSEGTSRPVEDQALVAHDNVKPSDARAMELTTGASQKPKSRNESKSDGGTKDRKRERSRSRSLSRHRNEIKRSRRSRSRGRRSRSRGKRSRSRGRRSRSRGRRSRSRGRRSHSKGRRSRSRGRRSRSRGRRSRSRDRRSSRRSRRSLSRSPRRSLSHQKSPRRKQQTRWDKSRSRSHSKSRSRSRPNTKSRSHSREPEENSRFAQLQVVQSVSRIAKEFGSLKKQVEIGKLTTLCVQLAEEQAGASTSSGKNATRTDKDVRAPFEVNPVQPALVFENNAWKTSNQLVLEAKVPLIQRPVEEMFPVSAGVEHAGVQGSAAKGDNVFNQSSKPPVGDLVAKRLEATQRLQLNPADINAQLTLNMIDQQAALWAHSSMKPGQYTGRQVLNPLSMEAHKMGYQTWAKKHMFHGLPPVVGGFGLKMLKKMGWKEGQPLGLQGRGHVEPITLDVKTDRSGLKSSADKGGGSSATPTSNPLPKAKVTASSIAQNKHPVSALQEICHKRHWNTPQYQPAPPSSGYPFLFKVILPTGSYAPLVGSCTKKEAKANAASAALHGLGLASKTVEYSYSAL